MSRDWLFLLAAVVPGFASPSAAYQNTTAASPIAQASAQSAPHGPLGSWVNPHRSVRVEIAECDGGKLCGKVVWASEEARADAKQGGIKQLIGTELLREYRWAKHGK